MKKKRFLSSLLMFVPVFLFVSFFCVSCDDNGKYVLEIEAVPEEGGTVEGNEGEYAKGEIITVVADASVGYMLQNWTDGVSIDLGDNDTLQYEMPGEDVTLRANFVLVEAP